MTIKEAREAILDWILEEYSYDDGDVVELDEDDRKVGIAYCQYEDEEDEDIFVDEQWYADLVEKTLFCEIGNKVCITHKYETLEELIDSIDYEWLIGEADGYVIDHAEYFKEN